MEQVPRLSCERCKKRKIRCDKRNPCSTCVNSNATCDFVQRARLPRGRSAAGAKAKKSILEDRVARLESLLSQVQKTASQSSSSRERINVAQLRSSNPDIGRAGEFVAPEFWATLTDEVAGLREAFDSSDDEEVHPEPTDRENAGAGHALLFGSASSCICGCTPVPWPSISEEKRNILLFLYRERVDCLYKILHWPTALAEITILHSEPQDGDKATLTRLLELSIYFTALCSITNDEARNMGLGDRSGLLDRYREATERALSEAGFLQRSNVTVLQAFVIFLVGHRTFYHSATWWTLLAVAVRIGTGLRLGKEDHRRFNPMELELRRRLWYCIALLDTHGPYDRGTLPIIHWDDLGPAPNSVNDDELSPAFVPASSSLRFNDMSFFALMLRAMVCQKKIMSIADSAEDAWAARLQLVLSFETSIARDYLNVSEDSQPFERFMEQVAREIIASMHLILRRPPYKQRPGLVPSSDNFNVLEHATKLLQLELVTKSTEFAPWAWKSWVRWNALAIVLVELCTQSPGKDHDVACSTAVQSFNRYSSLIADTDTGMLWKPISKLIHRVQKLKRSNTILEQTSNPGSGFNGDEATFPSTSDFSMPNHDLNLDSHTENVCLSQNNRLVDRTGDAQIDWFTFTDSINMDYPIDWERDLI